MVKLKFATESDYHAPSEYTHYAVVQLSDDPVVWAIVTRWDAGSIENILRKFPSRDKALQIFVDFY